MVRLYKKLLNMGLLFSIACILSILSFPVNPLAIFKVINPLDIKVLWYIGWIVWSAGMVLIGFAYYYIYIRKTKVLIEQGIYKVIRHPMYLGWILAVFIATIFLYQHWVFIVVGIPGVLSIYLISIREEISNIRRFGKSYKNYIENVPRMNIILGIIRLLRRRNKIPN
jgi:protein-S-isoprenylcysteine O-methyltransferase Ste14